MLELVLLGELVTLDEEVSEEEVLVRECAVVSFELIVFDDLDIGSSRVCCALRAVSVFTSFVGIKRTAGSPSRSTSSRN